MRRPLLVFAIFAFVGCGIDAVATKNFEQAQVDAGNDTGTNLPPKGDAADDVAVDAPLEATPDAEAGAPFTPSHIPAGSYSLAAGDVTITAPTTVNTTARTIALNGMAAAFSPDITVVGSVAVWSVGALTTTDTLFVTGDRPLLIVAAKDVSLGAVVNAFAVLEKPGPGGSLPTVGAGKGADGMKTNDDASGGGGAGHGTAGAAGGDKNAQLGGAAGPLANVTGAVLIGGPGGGSGGGFTAAGTCAGRGRGGGGGGALQISAIGNITITGASAGIDVGGGGGTGGCKDSGGAAYSGGGGGGAGGLVVLESAAGIKLDPGTTIEASGGGGGGGGKSTSNGANGVGGPFPSGIGNGGNNGNGNGGNGGNGGVGGPFGFVSLPGAGANVGDTGGGGGGATGRVFLRTRGAAGLVVLGAIAGERTDDQTF